MVDPRTPVVVGVGQFTERIDDPVLPRDVSGRAGDRPRPRRRWPTPAQTPAAVAKAIDTVVRTAPVRDLRTDACGLWAGPTTTRAR